MWNVGTEIVPAVIGALGTIKKGLDQNLGRSQVTGRPQSYRISRHS